MKHTMTEKIPFAIAPFRERARRLQGAQGGKRNSGLLSARENAFANEIPPGAPDTERKSAKQGGTAKAVFAPAISRGLVSFFSSG